MSLLASAGVAATVIGTGVVADADPAGAADYCDGGNGHEVSTLRTNHLLAGVGKETEISGNREKWCDFSTAESCHGCGLGFYVCDYQGSVFVYNPDGSYADKNDVSSFHSGCSYRGWFYHDPIQGIYAEDKRFNMKWRSDITGGDWQTIGTIRD